MAFQGAPDDDDLFANIVYDKIPGLRFPTPGTKYTGDVTDAPKLVQKHVYTPKGDGPLAWWDKEQTQPKMAVVIGLKIGDDKYNLWADKPGALFRAIGDAQTTAGARVRPGGKLHVEYTHEALSPNGYMQKQYVVKYKAGAAPVNDDPWADTSPAAKVTADDGPPF